MTSIDIRLKDADTQLLKSFIGKELESIEHDEFLFTNTSAQAIQINFEDGCAFLYSFSEPLDYYGSIEDVAVWSVEEKEYPLISGKSFIRTPVKQIIKGIQVINENQRLYESGIQTYDVWVTRGIILELSDHQICFEKPVWFSEDIIIRKGYNLQNTLAPVSEIENPSKWASDTIIRCSRFVEKYSLDEPEMTL